MRTRVSGRTYESQTGLSDTCKISTGKIVLLTARPDAPFTVTLLTQSANG